MDASVSEMVVFKTGGSVKQSCESVIKTFER